MDIRGKVVAVTGAGSGIGKAMCAAFAKAGARGVAVLDRNAEAARAVADELGVLGLGCDVTDEAAMRAAIADIEARLGAIDLFCSNAGVLLNDPAWDDPASAPDAFWSQSMAVHLMSHVYAARILGPAMAARGGGYFFNTSSAAGVLTQLGSGPYSASKHAAVAFAESLAIAYRDRNVRVSVLCPQGVATPMVAGAMETPAVGDGIMSAEAVAEVVLAGLAEERFLILPHPQVLEYMRRKTSDYDRWLNGMARLRRESGAA